MKEIANAEELHSILLSIGKIFHDICLKHNIPYYMLGGTMLGAIRHKGFIPWDDDMDFGVPRKYFDQLKSKLYAELPDIYGVMTVQNSDALQVDIIKIQDKRTKIQEVFKENVDEEFGINIDIFPLDYTPNKKGSWRSRLISALMSIEMYRFLSAKTRPLPKKIVAYLIKLVLYPLNKLTIINYINNHLISNEGAYIANHYGAWGERETVPLEVIGEPTLYDFEDTQFYGCAKPHEYLSSLYGDYMQLPPENKRHIHITGMSWK